MLKRKGSISETAEEGQAKRVAVDNGQPQPALPLSSEVHEESNPSEEGHLYGENVNNDDHPENSGLSERSELPEMNDHPENSDQPESNGNEVDDASRQDENRPSELEAPSGISQEGLSEASSMVGAPSSTGGYQRNHRGQYRGHQGNNGGASQHPTFIHLRILVSSKEAVAILGKRGSSIGRIRDASNARLNLSENVPGIQERIVNIKGPAEYVAKAAGLIARTLYDEPFDKPSSPDARPFNLRILMPHTMMGALIGKGGAKFREIEEASAAILRAHEQPLPLSTDRILVVQGVADAIHIAVYYISTTYVQHKEYLSNARQQQYDPAAAMKQPRGPHGGGKWNGNNMSKPIAPSDSGYYGDPYGGNMMGGSPSQRYGPQPYYPPSAPPYTNTNTAGRYSGSRTTLPAPPDAMIPSLQEAQMAAKAAPPGQQNFSQEVYIPNEYVGSVIGKGGTKIKDIRHFSGSKVKVEDKLNDRNQRLIQIVGTPESNQVAIYLIGARIETDRKRNEKGQNANHPAKNMGAA